MHKHDAWVYENDHVYQSRHCSMHEIQVTKDGDCIRVAGDVDPKKLLHDVGLV
jgi:hypothetical protein